MARSAYGHQAGTGEADEEALLDRLDDVEGEGDEEEVGGEAQGRAGLAAANIAELDQEALEPAVGHAAPPSEPARSDA